MVVTLKDVESEDGSLNLAESFYNIYQTGGVRLWLSFSLVRRTLEG
jgi:hypothetical protein